MYCRICGSKIDDDMNFCPVCGSETWSDNHQTGRRDAGSENEEYHLQDEYGSRDSYHLKDEYGSRDSHHLQDEYGSRDSYHLQDEYGSRDSYHLQDEYDVSDDYPESGDSYRSRDDYRYHDDYENDPDYEQDYDKDYYRNPDRDYEDGYEEDYDRDYDKDYYRNPDRDYEDDYEDDYDYRHGHREHTTGKKSHTVTIISIVIIALAVAAIVVFVVLPSIGDRSEKSASKETGQTTEKLVEETTTEETTEEEKTKQAKTEKTTKAAGTVVMPNVSGKKLTDARKVLEKNNLKVEIQYEENQLVANGYVIRQSIEEGREMNEGDTIMLFVARNKETTTEELQKTTKETTTASPEEEETTKEVVTETKKPAVDIDDVQEKLTDGYWYRDGVVYGFYPDGTCIMYVEDTGWNMPWEQDRLYSVDEDNQTITLGGYGDQEQSMYDQTYSYEFVDEDEFIMTGNGEKYRCYQSDTIPAWIDVNITHHFPRSYVHTSYDFTASGSAAIYKGPGEGFEQTGYINEGDTVIIYAEAGNWGLTDCNNPTSKKGWVDLNLIY